MSVEDEAPAAAPAAEGPGAEPAAPPPLTFQLARDNRTGRARLITSGMVPRGLPELQMDELASNHCRAGRFLAGVVARKLVREAASQPGGTALEAAARLAGHDMALTRGDVLAVEPGVHGRFPETTESGPVTVRFGAKPADKGGRLSGLLAALRPRAAPKLDVLPPANQSSNKDQWLRIACHRLGLDAPAPKSFSGFDADLDAAAQRARQRVPDLWQRFAAGLPAGQQLLVKTGLKARRGNLEYVWVAVAEWQQGAATGWLAVAPRDCPEFRYQQDMRVADEDVFDHTIVSGDGVVVVPACTDLVAQDFGVDLT